MGKPLPSRKYLAECFRYNRRTGILTWRVRPIHHFREIKFMNAWNARYSGKATGSIDSEGYLKTQINREGFYTHRLIFKLVTGNDPPLLLDHRNCKRADNRWRNIRVSDYSQNSCNRLNRSDSTTGFKGVSFNREKGKYNAYIGTNGKQKSLGYFIDIDSAIDARNDAARGLHGEFRSNGVSIR